MIIVLLIINIVLLLILSFWDILNDRFFENGIVKQINKNIESNTTEIERLKEQESSDERDFLTNNSERIRQLKAINIVLMSIKK